MDLQDLKKPKRFHWCHNMVFQNKYRYIWLEYLGNYIYNPWKFSQVRYQFSELLLSFQNRSKNLSVFFSISPVWFSLANLCLAIKYMLKVNSKNTRKRWKICSKLTVKTQELMSFWERNYYIFPRATVLRYCFYLQQAITRINMELEWSP